MNIFVDTNIFYKDPFLLRGKNIILKELAKADNVKIFFNKAAFEEVKRGNKVFFEKNLKDFLKISNNLNKNIIDLDKHAKFILSLEEYEQQFDEEINKLIKSNLLELTPYYEETIEEIVKLDMHKIPPFFIDGRDKSVRDAIIWHSYVRYIQLKELEECYFISHNTKDFAKNHDIAKKSENKSYDLHSNLDKGLFVSAHKSVEDFIETYKEEVKEIFAENDLDVVNVKSLQLIAHQIPEILPLIAEKVADATEDVLISEIQNMLPPEVGGLTSSDYVADNGYFGELLDEVQYKNISSYGSRIIVDVEYSYIKELDVYVYNSVRDRGEEQYTFVGSVPLIAQLKANITWKIIDAISLLENNDFDVKDVISCLNPEDIEVEILSTEYELEYNYDPTDDGMDMLY
ncbi:PIN domain-containing protein [Staphylococcus pseudintermedius]|uniref:PIN domain-containing protein n=1 Tax=Staphylococcus pseudintermedius TaxID=283734 RepID=UPI0028FD8ADC|nr:PIN domain-containing protein [Staphylococcus pseudintermedius]MDU0287469.1 PIN domain-containing protein [Staphylococcus pseudintermedius]MDU0383097.1 PIN domain-containing protein [Staphylococcus pseudintermedius]